MYLRGKVTLKTIQFTGSCFGANDNYLRIIMFKGINNILNLMKHIFVGTKSSTLKSPFRILFRLIIERK